MLFPQKVVLHILTVIRARIFLMVGTVRIVGTVFMTARVCLRGSDETLNKGMISGDRVLWNRRSDYSR